MAGRPDLELPPSGSRGVEIPRPIRPLLKAMSGIGDLMFRLGVKIQGRPLVRLETVGARSGKQRATVLGSFPVGDRTDAWVVVASNGGSARHPGWAYNLVSNPDRATLDAGDGPVPVEVELLAGGERESTWDQVVALAPGYGRYTNKTDREMPAFRLTRRS